MHRFALSARSQKLQFRIELLDQSTNDQLPVGSTGVQLDLSQVTFSNDARLLDLSQVTFSNDARLFDLSQVTLSNDARLFDLSQVTFDDDDDDDDETTKVIIKALGAEALQPSAR